MRIIKAYIPVIFFCAFLLSLPSFSKEKSNNYHVKIPEFEHSPKIDGNLENPLWKEAACLDTFTQFEPQEGAKPSEKTIVYIGHDKKNLYIAIRCFDSNPKALRACLTQRDKVFGDDEVTIYLDTFNDRKKAFVFQVNPCGVQTDGVYTEMQRRGRGGGGGMGFERIDKNWDTFFLSDAKIDDKGYTAELAIPFKSLRFPNKVPQVWGLQVMRSIPRKNEEIYWYPRSRDVSGFLVQSGTLRIDGAIEKGKNLEVMPVLTGLKQLDEKIDPEAGLNLKYGITSNLTADITYNPDFSQVEADIPQIDVNQRYTLYYPEKRPFFLEGKDIFDMPLELIYTRKIVNPLWGVKLTGKGGKTSLGFLSSYDENATGIYFPGSPFGEEEVEEEKGQNYNSLVSIFRLKRDIFSESHIGFIVTDKEMGTSWETISRNYNRVLGIDGHFKFNNYYRFSFQVLGSKSKAGTSETGFVPAMSFSFSRNARHLNFSADFTSIPDEFEASSGFFRRKDVRSLNSRISYAFLPQNDLIISFTPSFEYRRIYDFSNTLTDEDFQFSGFISGWRQSYIWATFTSEFERYEGIDFRKKTYRTNFSSEPLSWLNWNIFLSFGDGIYYDNDPPYLGYKTSLGLRLTLKPFSNLRLFYSYNNDEFFKGKGGEKVYEINLISQRITFQVSRPITMRLTIDYNDYYKTFYNNILFSYEYRPGTIFYIGMDDNQEKDESGIFRVSGRYYFIKFSYWWRV